jgi:hypothetical protein
LEAWPNPSLSFPTRRPGGISKESKYKNAQTVKPTMEMSKRISWGITKAFEWMSNEIINGSLNFVCGAYYWSIAVWSAWRCFFVKAFSFEIENIGREMINIDWNGYDNASTHSLFGFVSTAFASKTFSLSKHHWPSHPFQLRQISNQNLTNTNRCLCW